MKVAGEKTIYKQVFLEHPNYLMLEPTNRCNLRCSMCSREELTDIGDLSFDKFLSIIDQLPGVTTLKFQGLGEAYLAPDAIMMLEECQRRRIEVVSITNCLWHLDVAYILPLLSHLYISYHAADFETYKLICGGTESGWRLLHENIRQVVGHKEKCDVMFNCVLSRDNYAQAPLIVERARALGVDKVRFQIMQNWTAEGEELHKDLKALREMNDDALAEALIKAEKIGKDKARPVSIQLVGNENFDYTQCIWPFERTYINKNGDVLPCHMRPAPKYSVGNIFERPFRDIWHGKELEEMRRILGEGKRPPKMCEECPYIMATEQLRYVRRKLEKKQDS